MIQKKTINLPKLIGHRGVKDLCPENTIESITKAFDIGLKYVEVDVKISKDEIPILLHDDTLDRTTNGSGLAINFNYHNLKKLDAGEFFYNKKTNIFIPKLEDVLDLCLKNNGNINIELKPNKNYEKINAYKIYELTKNINEIDIFFSSFDLFSIIEISELHPKSIRSLLIDTFDEYNIDELINIIQKYNLNICGLNINIISNEIIKKIKNNNILITVYSEKNLNLFQANECFEMGVDSLFIDDPTGLLEKI